MSAATGASRRDDRPGRAESPRQRVERILAAIAADRASAVERPTIAADEKVALTREQTAVMLTALERHGVEYVLIGGCAVSSYDEEVMRTEDLDVVLRREGSNLARAAVALEDLGAEILHDDGQTTPIPGPFDQGVFTPYLGGMLKVVTRHGPIDLVISMKGFPRTYEDLAGRTSRREVAGVTATVSDLDAVIESKQGAARAKDLGALPSLRALARRLDLDKQGP